jgi:hypothetical protein
MIRNALNRAEAKRDRRQCNKGSNLSGRFARTTPSTIHFVTPGNTITVSVLKISARQRPRAAIHGVTASDKQKRATPLSFTGNLPKLANHANTRMVYSFFRVNSRDLRTCLFFTSLFVSIRVHWWLRFPNAQQSPPFLGPDSSSNFRFSLASAFPKTSAPPPLTNGQYLDLAISQRQTARTRATRPSIIPPSLEKLKFRADRFLNLIETLAIGSQCIAENVSNAEGHDRTTENPAGGRKKLLQP